ncbi:hypothetical protein V8F20_006187 [Naviculisporaceae sp. PSN 640]
MDLETGEELIALKESVQDMVDPTSDGELVEEADEYARSTGLTIDSRAWPAGLDHETLIASTPAPTQPGELFELPGLQECAFRSIIPPEEDLVTPHNAINSLQQLVVSLEKEVNAAKLIAVLSTPSNLKLLKYEEPFLRSNPEADRRALANKLAAFSQTSLSNHRLPLHPVEPEDDESLEFSAKVRGGDKSVMKEMDAELFRGGPEMKEYVYKANEAPWSDDEEHGFEESVATYEGLVDQGYMTPPLSPRLESHTAPADYFVPDPEICLVPEPSPVCSEFENEKFETDIETAEKKIFKEDNDFWQSATSGESFSLKSCGYDFEDLDISGMIKTGGVPLSTWSQASSSPPPKAEDLKLESPLLSVDKIADWASEPQRAIKSEDLEQAKELIKSDDGSILGDTRFLDFLQSTSEKMMRTAEQEKLRSLDGVGKVNVPVMDFSAPSLDWAQDGCDTARKMFTWIKEHTEHVNWIPARWPSNKRAEQRMVWAPFPHIRDTKKLVSEDIEVDERIIARFVRETMDHEVVSSIDCVVKVPGFAFLRDHDYDDEMLDEETVFERKAGFENTQTSSYGTGGFGDSLPSSYMTANVGKKMMQGVKERDVMSGKKRRRETSGGEDNCSQTLSVPRESGHRKLEFVSSRDSQAAEMAMMDSALALRNFVDESRWDDHSKLVKQHAKMHNPKKPKVNSRFFGSSQQTEPDEDEETRLSQQKKQEEDARAMPPPPKPILALAPNITLPSSSPRVIIATSVSGLLVMELRSLIPGLGIVLRDYDKRRPRDWYPGLRSPNLDEADITLSPATGILLTTMVKLRQKSLPEMARAQGQASNSGGNFRHVVENVATRYERLMVFVSEGNRHSETITPLLGSDANALAEFQGFTAGLSSSCDISVVYLGGGSETLAKWIAATICQYADETAELADQPLLEEETCWELFLRRAGMNPYGAQAVLGILRNPREDDEPAVGGSGAMYGLPLFVMMTAEERVIMFEDIFRGRRVLNRVSEVLDQDWPPAPAPAPPQQEMEVGGIRHPYLHGSVPVTYTGCWEREEFQHRH